jgi:CheY-like chemotaxis protein
METKCTVLLVENNPDDARLAQLAFEKAQITHSLNLVANAVQAIDYLNGRGMYSDRERFPLPKLVLLDLGLPGVSGFELLDHLRHDPELKNLPVTVLSGTDSLRDVTRAYQLGAKSFLVKPSDLGEFARGLKETTDFWLGDRKWRVPSVFLQLPPQGSARI